MCVAKDIANKKEKMCRNRRHAGRHLDAALAAAWEQGRLVAGVPPAVRLLEDAPDDAVVCVLAPAKDAAAHIGAVLLQAVCYENCVPVLQVDSAEKLSKYCGISDKKSKSQCCDCVIIVRDNTLEVTEEDLFPMSPPEKMLTEFYEKTLEEFPRPVIELPI